MGGRGSSSASNTGQPYSDAEWNARATAYIDDAISKLSDAKTARDKQLLETSKAAKGLVGSEKLDQMRYDNDVAAINRFLGDWSHPYTGYGSLNVLDDALTGLNRPLGSSSGEWKAFGDRVRSANDKGYTNVEIAALLRFDTVLNQYW